MEHIDTVRAYFQAWLTKNPSVLSGVFSEQAVYSECYGPEYRGLHQIQRWFADWNMRGTVLQWDIKNMIESGNTLCVEWYFRCDYEGSIDGFDGVSWIEFDDFGRIAALREFQSKSDHVFPYGQP